MRTTRTFDLTAKAYADGNTLIINRGGTRSGKSFAILQLIYYIASVSKKPKIITCVSHSFPHLEVGIVRDFDRILIDANIMPDSVRTKRPYIYKIGLCTIEFISIDKPGKALGAARDILFINECNKVKHNIARQLITRTTRCTFLDFNPDGLFWLYDEGYYPKRNAIEITSTYLDNYVNLSQSQKDEFEWSKEKADNEKANAKNGYWSFWWQVYGLGQFGRMVDRMVYPDIKVVDTIPDNATRLPCGMDFGFSPDPTTLVDVYLQGDTLYIDERLYMTNLMNVESGIDGRDTINGKLIEIGHPKDMMIIADSAEKKSIWELRGKDWTITAVKKYPGSKMDSIRISKAYNIKITSNSVNTIREFTGYQYQIDHNERVIPGKVKDGNDHTIDAFLYVMLSKHHWNS